MKVSELQENKYRIILTFINLRLQRLKDMTLHIISIIYHCDITWRCEYYIDSIMHQPFKAQWSLYVPSALTISNSSFCI
jgi:hypothetical protein